MKIVNILSGFFQVCVLVGISFFQFGCNVPYQEYGYYTFVSALADIYKSLSSCWKFFVLNERGQKTMKSAGFLKRVPSYRMFRILQNVPKTKTMKKCEEETKDREAFRN